MVIDNPEEVLRLALSEDHSFFQFFSDPIITNVYQPDLQGDQIEISGYYRGPMPDSSHGRLYYSRHIISNRDIEAASRNRDYAFGSETLRHIADAMVEGVQRDIQQELYNQLQESLQQQWRQEDQLRGHTHNYFSEALRMPDNMSSVHPPEPWDPTFVSYNTTPEMIRRNRPLTTGTADPANWSTPGDRTYRYGSAWGTPHTQRIASDYGKWANEANKKARELLFSLLTEEQQKEYLEHNRIIILSEKGSLYVVMGALDSNIYLLNSNDPKDWNTRYCAGISDRVPFEDNLVAQILMLQGNEEEFIRIANVIDSREGLVASWPIVDESDLPTAPEPFTPPGITFGVE